MKPDQLYHNLKETAEKLGITESAGEARLHRARQKLRRELTTLQVVET